MKQLSSRFLPLLSAAALSFSVARSFAAPIQWTNTTGGPGYHVYAVDSLAADTAGDLLVTGRIVNDQAIDPQTGNPKRYLYATKYAGTDGHLLWSYTSPQSGSLDEGRFVRTDADGNVVVAGFQNSRIYIAKLSKLDGHLLWEGPPLNPLAISDVKGLELAPNGDVIVAGWTATPGPSFSTHYFYTARFSGGNGHLIWQQGYSAPGELHDLALDPNGHVLVTGEVRDSPQTPFDFLAIKYDAVDGHVIWENRFPAGNQQSGHPHGVAADADGNAFITGWIDSCGGCLESDLYTAKLAAADGHIVWSRRVTGLRQRGGNDVVADKNGNAVVAGYDFGTDNFPSYYVASYDAGDGHLLWEHRNRGSGDFTGGEAKSVKLAPNGRIFVAGAMGFLGHQIYTAAYSPSDGAIVWQQGYILPGQGTTVPREPLALLPGGDLAVTGTGENTSSGGSLSSASYDLIVVKYGTAAQLLNISTRAQVLQNDEAVIAGFIVTGSAPKKVLLRGIGPSLALNGALQDPVLELHKADGSVVVNDDWKETQQAEIAATTIPPPNDKESAIIATVPPGAHTALLRGKGGGTGLGLVEVYDIDSAAPSTTANISTRAVAGTGNNVLIGGVILRGPRASTVLLRAIGPSLASVGIANALQDPTLELVDANGGSISNDDWKRNAAGEPDLTQQSRIERTGAAPSDDRESALLATVAPGNYTAIVRGKGNTTGTALVEFYNLEGTASSGGTFSFETDLEEWTVKATDTGNPTIAWSIAPSQDRASDGVTSLLFALENTNDAGKIWIERPFTVEPGRSYHVDVRFALGTADWGTANLFTIITGVRTSPALTRYDLSYQDSTGNGESRGAGYKWLEKSYGFDVVSGADGTLYVDLGIWGTWETYRAYYIDNVRVAISEN